LAEKHFFEQKKHTKSYLVPYFQKYISNFNDLRVLEIGCAEGGFLDVLYEMGIDAVGLELQSSRVKTAKDKNPNLEIIVGDITDDKIVERIGNSFDLVIMRDVIEHIADRRATFSNIDNLLNKEGYLYVAFPPKFSGFAGHQQNGRTLLRFTPFLHLLPRQLIRFLGKVLNERQNLIESIISNYDNGLTIRSFERYLKMYNFTPIVKDLFLFRPIYKTRFNVSQKKFPNIPFIREFIAFGCEYLSIKN
jgi:SAM-dependent methyltransferase